MSGCMSAFSGMPEVELCLALTQLKEEHKVLYGKLDEVSLLTEKIEKEENVEANFAELKDKVIEFKAILDPHSEREENVLFPMIGVYIGTTSGPIAVMEYEHDQAKEYIGTFLANSEQVQASTDELKKISELAKHAYHILTEHFAKEENVLFPMAERMLSDEEKDEFLQKIKQIN
ncbi:hemerythrin domain-containing protein [Bacillota bacterium Lsc_1132]